MTRGVFFIILGGLILFYVYPSFSATINVPGDSATIQAGINGAVDGDTVLIADGTYTGEGNRDIDFLGKAIVVISENGPEYATIDCQADSSNPHRAFIFYQHEDTLSVLNGFSLINGYGLADHDNYMVSDKSIGGSILCIDSSSPMIEYCLFVSNIAYWGGAISIDESSPLLISCKFYDNISNYGGAVAGLYTSSKFVNCEFQNNIAIPMETGMSHVVGGAILLGNGSPLIDGCDFTENKAYGFYENGNAINVWGGAVFVGESTPTINGCGFYRNGLVNRTNNMVGTAMCFEPTSIVSITACEVLENYIYDSNENTFGYGAICAWNCSLSVQGSSISKNKVSSALYLSNNLYANIENCILINNSSFYSAIINDGSFPVNISKSIIALTDGMAVKCQGSKKAESAEFCFLNNTTSIPNNINMPDNLILNEKDLAVNLSCCDIYGNFGGDWIDCISDQADLNGNISEDPLFCDTSMGDYHIDACSPCAPDKNSCSSLIGAYGIACNNLYCGPVWHVAVSGNDTTGDGSESNPFATIQYAIDASQNGDTVSVNSGIYTGDGNRDIHFAGKAIVLMSMHGSDSTIIDAQGLGRGFYLDNTNEDTLTVIRGFTITNGWTGDNGGGVYCLNSSPSFNNCKLQSNVGHDFGGGFYCVNGEPKIENCEFLNNTCNAFGGGVFVYSNAYPTITNCIFDGNSSQAGGGLWIQDADCLVENCLFINNSGLGLSDSICYSSAIATTGSIARVNNCTIIGNDTTCSILLLGPDSTTFTNCLIAYSGMSAVSCYYAETVLPNFQCCNIYGNIGGDWVGCIADQLYFNGNFSLNPRFCIADNLGYYLASNSPCLSQNNSCGVLIGAYGLGCDYLCGDANDDGNVNIFDVTYIISYLYMSAPPPPDPQMADVNDDDIINIFDITYLITYLYLEGPEPSCT